MSIYFDGFLAEQRTDATLDNLGSLKAWLSEFKIGSHWKNDNDFVGKMDDFRVYDYALSSEEVIELFRGGNLAVAWGPEPSNGSAGNARDVDLVWRPGDYAVEHDIYFGNNWDDVNDATTATASVYKGRSGANTHTITSDLDLGATYYWRIDEVNENDPCIWKGSVWQFTVAGFLLIDDFESYNDSDNLIYYTWIEDDASAYQDLGVDGFDPVRPGGKQSLWFGYNNAIYSPNKYYSEVWKDLGGMDFTEAGVEALTVWFYGQSANDAGSTEDPYLGLDDGTTYADSHYSETGNPITDIQEEEWHEWNVALSDFTGVTLSSIDTIFIGIGTRGNTVPGGQGDVFFDDLRLYPPRCIASYGPEYDWSGNCIVDLADVRYIADKWLRSDAQLSVQAPSPGPVGYWELDDGFGVIAEDSTANNNDGTLEGETSWVAGKVGTGAVEFTGAGGRVRIPHAEALMPSSAISVAAWMYPTQETSYSARVIAKGVDANDSEPYYVQFSDEYRVSWTLRDEPNRSNHPLDSDEYDLNEWIHMAGTYDGDIIALYINGQLEDSNNIGDIGGILYDSNDLSIGNASDVNNRAFIGKIDDVRVYNYALSASEVAYVAAGPSGYIPLELEVNIYNSEPDGQKAVNFRDLALFMEQWMDQILWPFE
jgi:hypothetical protein